jgi:hypothetical protein
MQHSSKTPVQDAWKPSSTAAGSWTTGQSGFTLRTASRADAEDLVYDPESLELTRVVQSSISAEAVGDRAEARAVQKCRTRKPRRPIKFALCLCAFAAVASIVTVVACRWYAGSYAVEARLVYIIKDHPAKGLPEWTVDKDLEGLKNPEVAVSAAQELCMRASESADGSRPVHIQPAAWTRPPMNLATSSSGKLPDPRVLAQWLLESLNVESERSSEATKVGLTLKGDDIAWLQVALDVYVRHFIEYRSTMESNRLAQARLVATEIEPAAAETPSSHGSDDELKRFEQQERGFQLAMRLMDSGPGTFGGFIPDSNLTGTPSLARFQDKIVELEIKKRGLLVQFTPGSKEVRAVDQEIKGIRAAMRECLAEYMKFLKSGKQCLLSTKEGRQTQKAPERALRKPCNTESSGRLPNGDSWFRIQDGLLVVSNTPRVVEKPLLVRANEFTHKTLATLPGGTFITRAVWSGPVMDSGEPTTVAAAYGNHADGRETSQWPLSYRGDHAGLVRRASDSANGPNLCNLLPDIKDSLDNQ